MRLPTDTPLLVAGQFISLCLEVQSDPANHEFYIYLVGLPAQLQSGKAG